MIARVNIGHNRVTSAFRRVARQPPRYRMKAGLHRSVNTAAGHIRERIIGGLLHIR
jgi:hypothetical protein